MHELLIGQTGSGKTTLAKRICSEYKNHGFECVVFDPQASEGWDTKKENKYYDPEIFLDALKDFKNMAVFIDESPILYREYKDELNGYFMRGRHRGLKFFCLAQRYKNIPTDSRGNASVVYAFKQSPTDTKMIIEDYPLCPDLSKLNKLEYYSFDQFNISQKKLLTF